jgi:hypothetical protein
MSNEKSIVRVGQVPVLAQSTLARDAALKRIEEIKQNPSLSLRQKRDLVNAEITAIVRERKKEIEHREKLLDMKLASDVRMAQRAIEAYQSRVISEIQDEVYKFIHKEGKRKMFARFELMGELGEKLGEFKRSLGQKKIEKRVLKNIMAQADHAVDDAIVQLGKSAAELIVPAPETDS